MSDGKVPLSTPCEKPVDLGVVDYLKGAGALRPFMPCALPAGHHGQCSWRKPADEKATS